MRLALFVYQDRDELRAQVLASPALVDGVWYWRTDRELVAIGR